MKKINVITLGCSKNTVDSEHLMARLAAAGYEVLFDSDRTDAKVVVINTCGFIGDAKQESIDMILRAAAAKQAGKIERLFVVGMPLGTLRRRTAGRDSRGGRLFRRTHVGRHRPCTGSLGGPGAGHRTPSDDPETLRLPENFGRLQLEMRLLRHSAHPRRTRLRPDGGAGGGGPQAGRAGRPGADGHRAGHDLLRHRPLRPADARRAAAPPGAASTASNGSGSTTPTPPGSPTR